MQEYEDVKAGADSEHKRTEGIANAKKEGKDHPKENKENLKLRKKGIALKMRGHKAGSMSMLSH